MSLYKFSWVVFNCWVFSLLLFKANVVQSSVNFSKAPASITNLNSATFLFNVLVGGNEVEVSAGHVNCTCITCKLDYDEPKDCGDKNASYEYLKDGNHKFEVCSVGSPEIGCSTYDWIVDTVPPTAYITPPASSTNAMNVSVNIFFTEACIGEDGKEGFKCSSVNACNLLVDGGGQVIPSTLRTLMPKREYSIFVDLSMVEHGNVKLEMDDNFCADAATNKFRKTENSTSVIVVDRRIVSVNLSSPGSKKLFQLDTNKTVLGTNNYEDLKLYLNFSESVVNSSAEILKSMNTSLGTLVPIRGENHGNRIFGFKVVNVSGRYAEITVSFNTKSILTKLRNPLSLVEPITLLYDSQRPQATLIPESKRTRQHIVRIDINFTKRVHSITHSCILINGGKLWSLVNESESLYRIEVLFDKAVTVEVLENVTQDVLGNNNLASDALTVKHYSVPVISTVTSAFVTSTFGATFLARGLLTVSTAGLGSFSAPPPSLMSNPAGNLFRSIGHIQVYALSRWLAVTLPVEYYEFARSLQWSIPYFNLPWENRHVQPSSKFQHLERFQTVQRGKGSTVQTLGIHGAKSEAAFLGTKELEGWVDFNRSMFWLAVIGGSLILLHVLLILILKFKRKTRGKYYGVIASPRFEICLLILALPCICKASAGLIKGGIDSKNKPGDESAVAVGSLLLGVVASILVSIVLFLSLGVTHGKLLLYETLHQAGQKTRWYEHILGPGERGKWKWKNQSANIFIILSPLVEDLRGPLKLRKHVGGGSVTPADEKEGSEAPGESPHKHDDRFSAAAHETEEEAAPGVSAYKHRKDIVAATYKKEDAKAPENNPHKDEITADETKEVEVHGGSSQERDEGITASVDETKEAEAPESNVHKDDGHNIVSVNETKVTEAPGGDLYKQDDSCTFFDDEKMFGTLRIYYTLLQSVKQVTLGTLAGAFLHHPSTKSPIIILLAITCFQLFLLVILKPFHKRLVQLIEMISVASEVGMLTLCLVRFENGLSPEVKTTRVTRRGITMIIFFLIGYIPQMIMESYDLYKGIKEKDKSKSKSFLVGLKITSFGLALVLLPDQLSGMVQEKYFPDEAAGGKPLDSTGSMGKSGKSGKVAEVANTNKGSGTLALSHPSSGSTSAQLGKSFSFVTVASKIVKNIEEIQKKTYCGSNPED